MLGQEDTHHLVLERWSVLSIHIVSILTRGAPSLLDQILQDLTTFPREYSILIPKRKRSTVGKGKSKPQDSLKSVSFNPKTEFQLV